MKALAVLNIGKRSVLPKSRASFQKAASRWGCHYIEITEPVAPVHHYWQKAFVIDKLAPTYQRVLQLDADMLIRTDAPSPFDLVPADHLGVVSAHQYLRAGWISSRMVCVQHWARQLTRFYKRPFRVPRDERHLNGGFFLYDTSHHRPLFREWQRIGKMSTYCARYLPEQASLSVYLHNTPEWKVSWLPHEWNVVGAQQTERPDRLGSAMKGYIYHFTGGNKADRIAKTWYNHAGWTPHASRHSRSLISLIPTDKPFHLVEVGCLRGHNAAAVLHHRPNTRVTLVDLWQEYSPETTYAKSRDGNAFWTNSDWKLIMQEALSNLELYYGRYNILQVPSTQASRLFDRESIDGVFIDADHSYEGVSTDYMLGFPGLSRVVWLVGMTITPDSSQELRRRLTNTRINSVFPSKSPPVWFLAS